LQNPPPPASQKCGCPDDIFVSPKHQCSFRSPRSRVDICITRRSTAWQSQVRHQLSMVPVWLPIFHGWGRMSALDYLLAVWHVAWGIACFSSGSRKPKPTTGPTVEPVVSNLNI
jgi:hypothetical protein